MHQQRCGCSTALQAGTTDAPRARPPMTTRDLLVPSVLLLSTLLVSYPEAQAGGRSAQPRRLVIEPRSAKSVVATVGKPLKLSAHLELDDGKLLPIDDQVTWTSVNPSVLRVADVASPEPSGSVTPLRAGITAVTATYPRVSDPSAAPATSRLLGDAVSIIVVEP
jgi:hypothetical protein